MKKGKMDKQELARINQILEANKTKSFVDRILNKDKYPTLDLGNGMSATHKMSYMQVGNKYHVFPTILYHDKKLTRYKPRKAYDLVRQTGNYIEFDTQNEADWFSKNYKAVWEE